MSIIDDSGPSYIGVGGGNDGDSSGLYMLVVTVIIKMGNIPRMVATVEMVLYKEVERTMILDKLVEEMESK
ncbi:conserved hypothetical protein [Ricinus communis]|uniref:Uncharacterized protein n=1 Tax=Ricinus communis TaxID=3988 RepID=B9SLC3_RICCO|nr:conserved hypothetical protein [Ricinus communis]